MYYKNQIDIPRPVAGLGLGVGLLDGFLDIGVGDLFTDLFSGGGGTSSEYFTNMASQFTSDLQDKLATINGTNVTQVINHVSKEISRALSEARTQLSRASASRLKKGLSGAVSIYQSFLKDFNDLIGRLSKTYNVARSSKSSTSPIHGKPHSYQWTQFTFTNKVVKNDGKTAVKNENNAVKSAVSVTQLVIGGLVSFLVGIALYLIKKK